MVYHLGSPLVHCFWICGPDSDAFLSFVKKTFTVRKNLCLKVFFSNDVMLPVGDGGDVFTVSIVIDHRQHVVLPNTGADLLQLVPMLTPISFMGDNNKCSILCFGNTGLDILDEEDTQS